MKQYRLGFIKACIYQTRIIKAESAEIATAYFQSIEPTAEVCGAWEDSTDYSRRGMPTVTVPEGWTAPTELDKKVQAYRDLMARIAELEKEVESIKTEIKEKMVEEGSEILEGSDWTARWVNVNSARFDTKRFKADHADTYAAYCKTSTTTRFTLTA